MTQKDKELLLKDLSARLPYGVIVQHSPKYADKNFADKWEKEPHDFNIIGIIGKNTLITDKSTMERTYTKGIVSKPVTICIYDGLTKQIARPYLRPMSSMTEEEREELAHYDNNVQRTDFFYSHHIDCRYMIEKGLALEAHEGMYKLKDK